MARMPDQLPTVRAPRRANARISVPDVSSGLGAVGETLDRVFMAEQAKRERVREQDDALALANATTRFRQRHTERLLREGDALADDAIDGFSDRYDADTQADAQAEIARLPERLRGRAEAVFLDAGGDLRIRAMDLEHGRRVARQGRLLEDQVRTAGATVYADPSQYAALLADLESAVDASGLPQAAAAQVRADLPRTLANDRLSGMTDRDPYAARRELRGGQWNEVLSAADIDRHLTAAEAEIARRRAEAERAAAAARARAATALRVEMEDDLASIQSTGRTTGLQLSRIERVLGPEAAEAYAATRRQSEENYTLLSRWRFQSPEEIAADVARNAPRAGRAGFAAAQERHQALSELAAGVIEARRTDPVAASMGADPVLAQMIESLTSAETTPAMRRQTIAALNDRQARLGVPAGQRRLTTNAQVEGFAASIRDAAPAERARAVENVLGQVGALYGAEAPRALAEIARVAELPELGALAAIPNARDRNRVARAVASPEAEISPAQSRALTAALDRNFAPLARSLANTPGGAERVAAARAAAERDARMGIAGGQSPDQAARTAAQAFLGQYQFRDGLRVPRQWQGRNLDAGRIASGARRRLDQIAESGAFQLPAGREAGAEDNARASADSLRQVGRWISSRDDLGLVLVDEYGDAIRDANGQPITATWRELESAGERNWAPPRG